MRRLTLQPLLAIALAALFAAPVAAIESGGAETVTLSGTLDALWIESPEKADGRQYYDLRTSRSVVALSFADGGPEGLGGANVEVTGRRIGRTLYVKGSSTSNGLRVRSLPSRKDTGSWAALGDSGTVTEGTGSTSYAPAAVVAKSFAVILINFSNLSTQPFTKAQVADKITGSSTSLRAFYEEESKGRMTVTGSVYGWYTIDAATTGCDWRAWQDKGLAAAAANGVNVGAFTNVMFIWPETAQCGFSGVAYVPGKYSYINGTLSVQVLTHEVGHNFGLSHANARNCVVNSARVWLSETSSCETTHYADPFSTMGNNALRHNHGSQLGELGFLDSSEKVMGAPGNTYTIAPYFGSGPVKLVRIPRGDGTYFDLDVRKPYGSFDTFTPGSPAVVGTTIRLATGTASPTSSPKMTELLDTTPSTTDLKDAPLLVGRTVKDPVSTISFTTLSADASGVTVQVKEGIKPSTPGSFSAVASDQPSVTLTWTASTDNQAVASYRVTRNGSNVGTIPAGTTTWTDTSVQPGTTYTYAIAAIDTSGNTSASVSDAVTTPGDAPTPTPDPTPTPTPDPSGDPSGDPDPANADTEAPGVPGELSGRTSATTVTVLWGAAADNTGVTGYRITRNGTLVKTVSGSTLAWTDSPRYPKTTYTYRVLAVDAAGNAGTATEPLELTTLADTTRPTTPQNFRVVARSGGYVTFAWSRSWDNVKVAKYYLYREGRISPIKTIWGTKTRIYARYGVKYFVRAMDTAGNRSYGSRHVRGR